VVVRQCSIKRMRLEGISYDDLIMSSVSLIGTCKEGFYFEAH